MRCGRRAIFSGSPYGNGGMATNVRGYEQIMRTPTECPVCKISMTIRNLRYKHRCKEQKTPSEVERLLAQAHEAAVDAHRIRMAAETAGST